MKNLSSYLKSAVFFGFALMCFLSLASYTAQDISLVSSHSIRQSHNFIGLVGAYSAFSLFFIFGYAAYFLPFYLFFLGWGALGLVRFFGLGKSRLVNSISFLLFVTAFSALIGMFFSDQTSAFNSAGLSGWWLSGLLRKYLNFYGSFIVLSFVMTITALLLFGLFLVDSANGLRALIARGIDYIKDKRAQKDIILPVREETRKTRQMQEKEVEEKEMAASEKKIVTEEKLKAKPEIKPDIKVYVPASSGNRPITKSLPKAAVLAVPLDKEAAKKKIEELEKQAVKAFDPKSYQMPSIDLLKVPPQQDLGDIKENIEGNIKDLENALASFGVEARVVSVQKGPVVTMYELQPQAGVKITQISSLHDDLALAMKAASVRIVAPIPGKGTIGVEIPNEKKLMVTLREVLEDKSFQKAESKLSIVIGKDVAGNPVVADLKDMPHLLIAGATGSGKTVCVNSLICSILFKARPDEVKFIMVDPKMVELACYTGIPHMMYPIISEAKKAFTALNWAVEEMERRYKTLAASGTRNIDSYNNGRKEDRMPFIVLIIDELADLMTVARDTVETSIQRLAQLSRAVGIHLVLATQRPSVDVITGVIKANLPARISFKVAAKVDSRTVLDAMGADKLLGKGDLLFLKPGAIKIMRAQGSFMDDEDINSLTDFLRTQGAPVYEKAIDESEKKMIVAGESDELLDEAIRIVLSVRQASASILQRRMRVGYTRAARLLDLMEQEGIVGPFCGSKAREIMVDTEQYLAQKTAETQV
jgi:S-DNA-T family DNA segregation ATPase FtsK/SpoIIIE